jgi:thiamine biosynthesis lipoprotein
MSWNLAFEGIGTHWSVTIWDDPLPHGEADLEQWIRSTVEEFEQTYSRFRKNSFIWTLATMTGRVDVPEDLVTMLRLYQQLNQATHGKCNPCIGQTLRDLGYDETYSLKPKERITTPPPLPEAVTIVDATHIEIHQPVLLDLGAVGKGYLVDLVTDGLMERGATHLLVNAGGDIRYHGPVPIRCGLEDPEDATKAIGVLELSNGALCASSGSRRRWAGLHHTIDPETKTSPERILATWVTSERAAVADGLCTCLFFTDIDDLRVPHTFDACVMNNERRIKKSAGFTADFFTR